MSSVVDGHYKLIERRMVQLSKASQCFRDNVEVLSEVNTKMVGFHTVFSNFLVATKTAAARFQAVENPCKVVAKPKASPLSQPDSMEEEVPSKAVPPRSAKRDRRAEGKKERQPELTGPQKAQAALQEMIPNKFNSEGHLRQIYLVLVAACKEEDGSSVPKLACETGLGRVQLQEYLTVLVRCNQLLKMRTKGLKYCGNNGNILQSCLVSPEEE